MKRENNKKFKKRKRNQKRSLTCRVLSMMFAIVLFCSTVLINTDYVSQASSFDDMVDMVEVEEDSAAVDTSEDTGDNLDTDVNFESEEGTDETYSESDDFGSSDVDFSSGENMFTDGTSESSTPAEEAAQPVSCIVNLKNETIEIKAEAPAGVLPNGTQMTVKAVENNTEDAEMTDQYNKLAAKITEQLQSQGKNLDGFLAYNVSFTDADGNPVEPSDKVTYSFTYKEASSPELTDPAASTVTAAMIRTNKETSELELTELKAEEDQLTVETNESRQLTKAAFQSAATAAFTFVWSSTPAADDNENNENKEENGEVNNEEVNADTNTENTEENGEETNTENNVENSEEEQNPEEAPDQEQIKMIRITADEVNLRVSPSTEADVIATVDTDTQLPLLETVTDEDEFTWYKVSYEEAEAYVRSDMAEVVENEEQGTENEDANEEAEVQVEDEVTYSQKIDNVVVNATASKGVLPDDAQFVVTPIKSEDEQYEDIAARLEEKAENEEYSIAGFLAYDIYFLNSAGEKINPEDGKVKISMEYQNATAPEEVKESDAVQMDAEEEETSQENTEAKELSVSVMHFVEENGEVTSVVDMTKENSAVVETNEAGEVQKAEFETESFSTFTITWQYYQSLKPYYKNLRVHLVYLDNNEYVEIPGTADKYYNVLYNAANIDLEELSKTYKPSGYKNPEGYENAKVLAQDKKTEIKFISYNTQGAGNEAGWFYSLNKNNWFYLNNDDNYNVYFVYDIEPGVLIMDKIADDGSLEAKYTSENDDTQTTVASYEWYKSDSKDGTYTKVEKINYQAGTSTVSNISDDGAKLYPAYDDGARKWYKVKVTLSDNDNTEVYSSPYQVAYYNQLQNGSFEEPTYDHRTNQISNANYATDGVWQTTGTHNGLDIEIVRQNKEDGANAYAWWTETGNNTSLNRDDHSWANAAYAGSQFAELNCEAAGALYQDVLTIPGTSLNYWLAHRARGTNADSMQYDTMYLVIMPKSAAVDENGYELTTQTQLETKLTGLGCTLNGTGNDVLYNQNGIKVLRVTSTNQRWQYINAVGIEGYTPTSSLTRFFFMSGKTASGKDTVGNFLDQVGFSQELPPVADDEFTLQIKKSFEGLGSADIEKVKENISFKIKASKDGTDLTDDEITELFGRNTITGSDMAQQLDGSLQYTIANKKIGVNDIYQVEITEENAGLSGYTLNTSATTSILTKGNDTPEETDGSTFKLQGKKTATVTFTNTYEADNQKQIHFTKIWDDNNNDYGTRPDSLVVTLHATYDANGQKNNLDLTDLVKPGVTITLNAASEWKCSWKVPVYYTLANGNKAKIDYTVTEGENTSDYVYKAVTDDGKAFSGDGSDYHYQFNGSGIRTPGDTTSAQSAPKKSRMRAVSNNDELSTVAATNGTTTSDLGEPAHTKYITYNSASGDYTLHLDVTGAKGSAKGVDVLFVIDTSGSMGSGSGNNNLLPTVKTLLTKNSGLVDKIFSKTGNVNSVAMVSFSDMYNTNSTSWYGTSSKADFKKAVNDLSASGGTNWTYAMVKARELLDGRSNSSNEKVVIFLSDGKPTYSCEKKTGWFGSTWEQKGNGSKTKDEYYKEAANQVTGSLESAKMYSVYLTSDTKDGMETFSEKLKNSELVDGTRLENALTGILNKVIPTYKNVTITDTLSTYVDFAETTPTITVTRKNATGTTTLTAGTDYTPNCSGKTVTVQLLNGNSLEDGATYTVSFRVKPSDAANDYYKNRQSYPNIGDAGTGTTSAGKNGFYSNDNDLTKISYEIDGTSDGIKTASYIKPVVQVTTHTLTYTKVWNHPSGIEKPTQDVKLNVTYSDGTTGEITLTKDKEYTYQESVPVTKYIVSVTETPVADYEASYSITDNGTNAVVTNNYNKVTASNITVTKVWNGGGPQPAITVGLYRSVNGEPATRIETVTLSFENDWSHTWNKLPKSEGNTTSVNNYSYAVREESIPSNYQSSISYDYGNDTITATITNTYDPNCADENYYIANVLQTEKLRIIKTWDDNSNEAGKRPTDLSVNVNGMNFTLSGDGNRWTQDATILKKKNATYEATENLTSFDYRMISSTVTSVDDGKNIEFVNQLKTKEITVHKVWKDGNAADRPTSVKIRLDYRAKGSEDDWTTKGIYIVGLETASIDGNTWTYVIPKLLTTYDYRVVELNDNGEVATAENNGNYIPSITPSGDTFTITNTLKWSAVKTSADDTTVGLSGAEFELKNANGDTRATGTSGEGGAITWEPVSEDVNLYTLNGEYKIYETKAPAGYMKNDSGWTVTFANGLLTQLNNAPTTGTAENGVVIELTNQKVYTLPSTGGSGIYWYMIGGMVLMSTAVWILYKNKCREVLGK